MILSNCAFCSSLRSALMSAFCLVVEGLHLRARIGVATAQRFHQRRRSAAVRLLDRVGLGEDRVRDLHRILEDRHDAVAHRHVHRRHRRPAPSQRSSQPRTSRPPSLPSESSFSLFCPQRRLWSYRRARIRRRPGHHYRRIATSVTGAPIPAQRQASWAQQLSCRPLAQTLKTAILTRPSTGRLE